MKRILTTAATIIALTMPAAADWRDDALADIKTAKQLAKEAPVIGPSGYSAPALQPVRTTGSSDTERCLYDRSTITGWCNSPPRTYSSYSYWWYSVPRRTCNPLSPRCNY